MVFVTVGTATQSFQRLLRAVDEQARAGLFGGDHVFFQTGFTTDFVPESGETKAFISRETFTELVCEATQIIAHGGVALLDFARLGKVPVAMPRRKKYGEHVNDHQVELIEVLAGEGRVVPAWEPSDLASAVQQARQLRAPAVTPSHAIRLVEIALRDLTDTVCGSKND